MPVPIIYNIRSIKVRYASSLVAILAIAGVVAVFISVLAMAKGFQKTLMISGSEKNVVILRGGANSEMESALSLDQAKIIGDIVGIEHDEDGQPMVSPEIVVIAAFKLRDTNIDANVQVRGVSKKALKIRSHIKIKEGRFFNPGLTELVVGSNATKAYSNMQLNQKIRFAAQEWTVVGIMDAGSSSFDSEVWCDSNILSQVYKRLQSPYQSITATLKANAFKSFRDSVSADPRLTVSVQQEIAYYEKQSEMISNLIKVLGFLIASIMAIGAVFGALNTMYSAISARAREIAVLSAIGFRGGSILISFVLESLFISALGGILGAMVILPIHGKMASTINWQTFSHISFSFVITPDILISGMIFALIMGFLGGLLPALRASRLPVSVALRGL